LNFLFILFKFIRRLRENDRLVEAAQQETAEILGTVKEGLFLLDGNFKIGSQFSASLSTILGISVSAGMDFRDELRKLVYPDTFEAASDYIGLLLAGRVSEALVEDLNPLIAIPVQVRFAENRIKIKYLTFLFNRVIENGVISHLLVSVFDVTEQQELESALAEAKKQAKTEVEVMLEILKIDPVQLAEFLTGTEKVLHSINHELKDSGAYGDPRKVINLVFRHIHTIKGEAAALGLEIFEGLAQQFEQSLAALRDKPMISDDDLLALPGPLDEFFQKVSTIRELSSKLSAFSGGKSAPAPAVQDQGLADSFVSNINTLAHRIARDHDKSISLTADLEELESLPVPVQKEVKDIALQLIRNAVAHGVEPMHVRKSRNKAPMGSIYIGLDKVEDDYELIVRDDGHGLVAEDIKQALIAKGLYTETQLQELDQKQIVMKIFEPGFSTTTEVDRDSGQGVGMDIVKQKISALGARLGIASQKNLYTMFSIRFQI
jgi:signal transduction histidine kinase